MAVLRATGKRSSTVRVPACARARCQGNSRGTMDNNGQNPTDRAPEDLPAHSRLWAGPLQGGTRLSDRAALNQKTPSPGGQISGMISHKSAAGSGWDAGGMRVGISSTSLQGYYTALRGQS